MEHIEEAGIHSGDSACALPPITLGSADLLKIRAATEKLAARIGVRGLMNVQYAIKDDILYVIEANPRASRTVPFVSKATAVQLAKAAARIAVGETIADLRDGRRPARHRRRHRPARATPRSRSRRRCCPFHRFRTVEGQHVDTAARPGDEVHRRGHGPRHRVRHGVREVAGRRLRLPAHRGHGVRLAGQPGQAERRSSRSSGWPTSASGCWPPSAPRRCCAATGCAAEVVGKFSDGPGNVVERILAGDVDIVVNTPFGSPGNSGPRLDGYEIRTAAVARRHPVHHHGAGHGRRGAGHRVAAPRRHRRAQPAGGRTPR